MYRRALFATATATYSSRRCLAEPPPSPAKIRGEDGAISERKVLPPKLLSENVAMLTCESSADGGVCNVYLVGTRHRSPESRREVKDVIEFLKPEVVFLELCPNRLIVMHEADEGSTTVQRHRVSEFAVAYSEAMKYGVKVILGDRPIEITMKRMAVSKWDLIKIVYYTVFHKDGLRAELEARIYTSIDEPLVHERDQYMSAKILEVASEHNSVVAIVGNAHLSGIQKNWKQPVELERLLSVPTRKNPSITPLLILNSVALVALAVKISRLAKK